MSKLGLGLAHFFQAVEIGKNRMIIVKSLFELGIDWSRTENLAIVKTFKYELYPVS
ncbi:hypothetical protein D3C85_1921850 [compost metagenome]